MRKLTHLSALASLAVAILFVLIFLSTSINAQVTYYDRDHDRDVVVYRVYPRHHHHHDRYYTTTTYVNTYPYTTVRYRYRHHHHHHDFDRDWDRD